MIVNACVAVHNLSELRNVPDPLIVAAALHLGDDENVSDVEYNDVGDNAQQQRQLALAEQRFLINHVAQRRGVCRCYRSGG